MFSVSQRLVAILILSLMGSQALAALQDCHLDLIFPSTMTKFSLKEGSDCPITGAKQFKVWKNGETYSTSLPTLQGSCVDGKKVVDLTYGDVIQDNQTFHHICAYVDPVAGPTWSTADVYDCNRASQFQLHIQPDSVTVAGATVQTSVSVFSAINPGTLVAYIARVDDTAAGIALKDATGKIVAQATRHVLNNDANCGEITWNVSIVGSGDAANAMLISYILAMRENQAINCAATAPLSSSMVAGIATVSTIALSSLLANLAQLYFHRRDMARFQLKED